MEEIFQKIIDDNFSDLEGLKADVTIPVPQNLLNEIIAAALEGNQGIGYCLVSIGAQNRISVKLKTMLWPWPLNLKLRLFRSVDLASSPKIRAALENHLLLGKLGSFLNVLPKGFKIYGNQVVVEVASFLPAKELMRMLDLVESAEIRTEVGKMILDIKFEVD